MTASQTHGPILVVEDDADIRQTIADVLQDEGYEVAVAGDGLEALATLERLATAPCLILLDLMMPTMDGWAFSAELKKRARFGGVPVVVLSGSAHVHTAAAELGCVAAMAKPLSLSRLLAVVDEYC